MKATRGKLHNYFLLTDRASLPSANNLFGYNTKLPKIDKEMKEDFHTFTAKGLSTAKCDKPDTGTSVSVLTTYIQAPSVDNWNKLVCYMQYVKRTQDEVLTLSADNLHVIKWFAGASFAVHPDFRSHTGAVMTYGEGAVQML